MTTIANETDHPLKRAIERELDWACDVDNDRVGVTVTAGAVMLSGEVLSYPEKVSAVKTVLRVRGVTAVADEIVVLHSFGRITDVDIARAAAAALQHTTLIAADTVRASVHDHMVTLTGTVNWHHQRRAAAHAVSVLPGVAAVHNLIELEPRDSMVSSADAEANVRAALRRSAQLEVRHIDVAVSGTEIELTGTVANWAASHDAEYAAWCTPGVTHVDNQLVITGGSTDDVPA
jgi:osmotically-inducible protein OsmY